MKPLPLAQNAVNFSFVPLQTVVHTAILAGVITADNCIIAGKITRSLKTIVVTFAVSLNMSSDNEWTEGAIS